MQRAFLQYVVLLPLVLAAIVAPPRGALAGCAPIALTGPRVWPAAATGDTVRITFLGHASFQIVSPAGVQAVTDYNGINIPPEPPDIATMNHAHSTHYTLDPDPRIAHVLHGWQEAGHVALPHALRVNGRIGWSKPIMIDHYQFLASQVRTAMPKQTIPSPSVVHFRGGRQAIDRTTYPSLDGFFGDLGEAYSRAVAAFGSAGCRYLQIDEVNIAYLCDPEQIAALKARGEHVDNLLSIYAEMLNRAIAGRPDGMTVSMHLCRGNFRSTWVASGGYEPVAEVLFNQIAADAYFMEYDTDRAGGFEPLRFVPRGDKTVVLGLVTSKTGALESKDELKRRIDQAAKYLPLEQLALSPQCGFASTEEGNTLTEDQQWAKLALCVDVAREVWGGI